MTEDKKTHAPMDAQSRQTHSALKKISKSTLTAISKLTPEQLEEHGIITPARTSGFLCPNCGNGSSSKGTGMTVNPKIEAATVFHCFNCHENFSVLRLCGSHFNLDPRANYVQLVEKVCADFGIDIAYEVFNPSTGKRTARRKKSASPIDSKEMRLIKQDLALPESPLVNFVANQPNKTWRALPIELWLRFGCRLVHDWVHPKNRSQPSTPTQRVLIPNSHATGYLARLIDDPRNYGLKAAEFIKPKQRAGRDALFNADALNKEFVFVVEGEIDAMSLEYAGFKAVALGGAGNGDLLLDALSQRDGKPPMILVMFDNDDTGKRDSAALVGDLLAMRVPAVAVFLDKNPPPKNDGALSGAMISEKIDANDILQQDGVEVLRGCVQILIDGSMPELAALAAKFGEKDLAGLSAEDWDFIFTGDASDVAFARRCEKFCAERVRWQTDAEHWLTYQNGIWKPRSEKNSVIIGEGLRLAEAMKQNAESKDERDLADNFQSTKKISSALTLLKGCDSIFITQDDLDRYNYLLACLNGVLDLQTLNFYPYAPELYMMRKWYFTKQAGAVYDPHADSSLVEKFFLDIMPDDQTRVALIRWLAYNITGDVRDEFFAIWKGSGRNGKGVLSNTMQQLLGTYAAPLPRTALIASPFADGNSHTAGLNAIANARFAISDELKQECRLDTSLLKTLSGGDPIKLRQLHKEFVIVKPTAKINMSTNFTPNFDNPNDIGLKERAIVFPFEEFFGEGGRRRDPLLKDTLCLPENLSGALNLFAAEAQAYYQDGLLFSKKMTLSAKDTFDENDWLGDFIENNIELTGDLTNKILRVVMLERIRRKCRAPIDRLGLKDRPLTKMLVDKLGKLAAEENKPFKYENDHGYKFYGIQWFDEFDGEPVDPPFSR